MARRVQLRVRLGREVPELPPGLLFSDTEPRLPAAIARPGRLPPTPGPGVIRQDYTQPSAVGWRGEPPEEYGEPP